LIRYLDENIPPTVTYELVEHAGGYPSITDRHMPGVQALIEAMEETWGKRPVFKRDGGSVPVVADLSTHLGIESVCTGFGLPDDNLHAPNEKIHVPTFFSGIDTVIRFLGRLGQM